MTEEHAPTPCGFTWPLLDPNEEDQLLKRTHVCDKIGAHWVHVCACGERQDVFG